MSETLFQPGRQLGPYVLDRRVPEADPSLGFVYEAHHVESGASALVLVPDPSAPWAPRAAWTVRSVSEVAPPFVAVEVERSAEATARALHELTLLYIRLSGALASVEDREDTATFLARSFPSPRPSRGRRARAMALAALGGLAMGAGLVLLAHPSGRLDTVLGAGTSRDEPTYWAALPVATPPSVTYPLPSTPLKGQRKPPCFEDAEDEINGGCWVQIKKAAPCPRGYAEHKGKCYMPSRELPPEPNVIKP